MSTLQFFIDDRERKLIKLFTDDETPMIKWQIKRLDIGDIAITWENETLLIERKTIDDLISSQNDNRYSEQKARMLSCPNAKVVYVFEGIIGSDERIRNRYEGTLLSMLLRDNIYTHKTRNVVETYRWLKSVAYRNVKMFRDDENYHIAYGGTNTCGYNFHPVKKKNITARVCYEHMLVCIPGVSKKRAASIAKEFPSMHHLLNALLDDEMGPKFIAMSCELVGKKTAESIERFLVLGTE